MDELPAPGVFVTNQIGHQLARSVGDETTLGAYRRGYRLPWVPGAVIAVWAPCARSEAVTGVPWPHAYFIQTIGGGVEDGGSIHCPACRAERAALAASGGLRLSTAAPRAAGPARTRQVQVAAQPAPDPTTPTDQPPLPF